MRRAAQFYPNINLTAFVGLSQRRPRPSGASRAANSTAPARRSACRSSMAAGCAPTCAAGPPTSMLAIETLQRHGASTRCATSPTSSARCSRSSASSASRPRAQCRRRAAYDLATQRYRAGLGTYLTVLNAETAVLRAAPPGGRPAGACLDTQVALIRALGGGYVAPAVPHARRADRAGAALTTHRRNSVSGASHVRDGKRRSAAPNRRPRRSRRDDRRRAAPNGARNRNARALLGVAALVVLAGIAYGVYWALVLDHFETTDNAYVQGNVVQLTPQVGGTVVAINADDTDFVKAGQLLVKLDPADAQVALDQAEAQLGADRARGAHAVRQQRRAAGADRAAARPTWRARGAEVARAQDDVDPARAAGPATGAVGEEEFNHATTAAVDARRARYAAAQSACAGGARAARVEPVADRRRRRSSSIRTCCAPRRACARPISRLRAPTWSRRSTATSRKRSVQVGQRVAGRRAADVRDRAGPGLGRCQLQGEPAAAACASASRSMLEADVYGKQGRLPRHDRRARRRHRRGVRAAAGAERDRQLDQGRPARAGAHRARSEGARRASAAGRPVDGREGRRQRTTDGRMLADALARTRSQTQTDVFDAGNAQQADGDVRAHHRREPRARPSRRTPRASAGARHARRVAERTAAVAARGIGRAPAPVDRSCRRSADADRMSGTRRRAGAAASAPARARRPPPRAPAAYPPLTGSAARARHDRAVARDLHERARHVDRERVDPGDLRRHGRQPERRAPGSSRRSRSPTRSRCR